MCQVSIDGAVICDNKVRQHIFILNINNTATSFHVYIIFEHNGLLFHVLIVHFLLA